MLDKAHATAAISPLRPRTYASIGFTIGTYFISVGIVLTPEGGVCHLISDCLGVPFRHLFYRSYPRFLPKVRVWTSFLRREMAPMFASPESSASGKHLSISSASHRAIADHGQDLLATTDADDMGIYLDQDRAAAGAPLLTN